MANLANFKFFDTDSTDTISQVFVNPNKGSSMTLEVNNSGSADFDLVVEGKSDMQGSSWFEITALSLNGFVPLESITEEGLYVFSVEGLTSIRLKNNGTVGGFKAFGISTGD